ncbi:MAG: DUF4422 domain-containing protein [Oscillospiraceae bacterium]|nr:DUF4422 domain-containing protein [Oscillospiraceae bacterium]
MEKKSVKIIVATHKEYEMPSDEIYLPLHVGAAGKTNADGTPLEIPYTRDDTGENISSRNYCFGTQTGLYWMWKNLDADYLGLVHYRRYFTAGKAKKDDMLGSVLKDEQLQPMLEKYRVFLPKKRRYYIESVYSHYAHTLDGSQLDLTRQVIAEKTPGYVDAFDTVMKRTSAYIFNMMIMEKALMDDYCSWMFPILFEVAQRVDQTGMTAFEKRFCGRISERLLNVWLEQRLRDGTIQKSQIKELPYTENVNWGNKIKGFLAAKLFHKKYGASF